MFGSLSLKKLWFKLKNSRKRNGYIYLSLWFGIIFVFYSLSDSKLVPYIVPCLIPLAILIANYLEHARENNIDLKIPLIINLLVAVLIIAALAVTAIKSDFISIHEFIWFGSPLILILLISNVSNLILWIKNKNIHQIVCISIVASILFGFSLQPVITEVAEHRTGKEVAQAVNLWKNQDTLIICYQDYLQDLPFYTKSRVALYDYYDELKFGSEHPSGQGWFLNKEEFLNTWSSRNNIILVVPKKRMDDCLKTLNTDLNNMRHREFEKYIVIKH